MKPETQNPNQTSRRSRQTPSADVLALRISGFGFRVSAARWRAAFSFAEVMFAVVILGIGFIMIAAIFPVAMQQSQNTTDESTAASIARQAVNTVASLPQSVPNQVYVNAVAAGPTAVSALPPGTPSSFPMFPPTVKNNLPAVGFAPPPAVVVPLYGPRWDAIKNSLILSSDHRYALVPFYRRDNGSSVAQFIVIAIAARNRSEFEPSKDIFSPPNPTPSGTATISAVRPFTSVGAGTNICPDTIVISGALPALTEGWFVSVPPVSLSGTPGRTSRLGRQLVAGALTPGTGTFEIEPADGMSEAANDPTITPADVLWSTKDDFLDSAALPPTVVAQAPATLQPVVAYASLYIPVDGSTIAGRITLALDLSHAQGALNSNVAPFAAAPGAFIIIADDWPYDPANAGTASYALPPNLPSATPPRMVGALNGRIFRLGQLVPADPTATPPIPPGTYDLDPAYGMRGNAVASPDTVPIPGLVNPGGGTNNPWARVFLVGAGRVNPQNSDSGYSGAAQDVAVYTTFIPAQ
jgi:hypothetical protein